MCTKSSSPLSTNISTIDAPTNSKEVQSAVGAHLGLGRPQSRLNLDSMCASYSQSVARCLRLVLLLDSTGLCLLHRNPVRKQPSLQLGRVLSRAVIVISPHRFPCKQHPQK